LQKNLLLEFSQVSARSPLVDLSVKITPKDPRQRLMSPSYKWSERLSRLYIPPSAKGKFCEQNFWAPLEWWSIPKIGPSQHLKSIHRSGLNQGKTPVWFYLYLLSGQPGPEEWAGSPGRILGFWS
jgi:hypothetical protein